MCATPRWVRACVRANGGCHAGGAGDGGDPARPGGAGVVQVPRVLAAAPGGHLGDGGGPGCAPADEKLTSRAQEVDERFQPRGQLTTDECWWRQQGRCDEEWCGAADDFIDGQPYER
jgi:hypothetical protein